MPLPDADRRALEQRLLNAPPATVAALDAAIDDDEQLRDALSTTGNGVVAITSRRVLFAAGPRRKVVAVDLDAVDVTQRDAGLSVDAEVVGGRLALAVPRSTVDRLAAFAGGGSPARATWLPAAPFAPAPAPAQAPAPAPAPAAAPAPAPAPAPAAAPAPADDVPVAPAPAPAPAGSAPPAPPRPGSRVPVPAGPWIPDAGWTQRPPSGSPAGSAAPPPPPPPPPPQTTARRVPPPGWHPDPSRRHWWRWWDGHDWTDHVADGGGAFTDPLPPRGQPPVGR